MKAIGTRKLFCMFLVLAILLTSGIPAYAWWSGRTVTKHMPVSGKVFGKAAEDIITFYTDGSGNFDDINVRHKELNIFGIASFTSTGEEIFTRTHKIRTYWEYRISLPLNIFSLPFPAGKRCIEYTLYADGSVSSKVISTKKK